MPQWLGQLVGKPQWHHGLHNNTTVVLTSQLGRRDSPINRSNPLRILGPSTSDIKIFRFCFLSSSHYHLQISIMVRATNCYPRNPTNDENVVCALRKRASCQDHWQNSYCQNSFDLYTKHVMKWIGPIYHRLDSRLESAPMDTWTILTDKEHMTYFSNQVVG